MMTPVEVNWILFIRVFGGCLRGMALHHKLPKRHFSGDSKALYFLPLCLMTGCNPVIGVAGATFPVWLLCLIVGVLGALSLRPLFVEFEIDEWMTPRPLVYACLALTIACLLWLIVWWKA